MASTAGYCAPVTVGHCRVLRLLRGTWKYHKVRQCTVGSDGVLQGTWGGGGGNCGVLKSTLGYYMVTRGTTG